jgi:glucose-6-phosphate 1-dehydrogenase
LPFITQESTVMAHTIVIFGASGDLTSRKLVPALYRLFAKGRLPDGSRIVGVSRSQFEHEQWRTMLRETTEKFVGKFFDAETWARFAENVYYQPGDIKDTDDFHKLAKFLESIEGDSHDGRVYYLSTMPQLYELKRSSNWRGRIERRHRRAIASGDHRKTVRHRFGDSAQALNKSIHEVFREDQIYRIDHYLGKETVQNIFRAALCQQHL